MFLVRRTALCCVLSVAFLPAALAGPIGFVQHNLVSNQDGVADNKDTDLKNAWGLATSATSPFWVGDNGSGLSTIYNTAGVRQSLVVTIPGDGSVTGVAFSGGVGFNGDLFLFASEDGTISGWRGALGATAEVLALPSDNVYKGLEFANIGGHGYALAANFNTGAVDVYKGDAGAPDLGGHFTDPNLPSGYAPFNIRLLGGALYVTYAQQNPGTKDDLPGAGHGFVSRFDLAGNFVNRVVSAGDLNSPWGLALAPSGFGDVGGDLLVGNFGDGAIHAYDPVTGVFHETLQDPDGNPLAIDGLWALRFGNGGNGGDAAKLYFTAGPDEESNGLFGSLTAVPEPATLLLALPLLGLVRRRRR
jgi:uncharacterized protein (TIGR03118 family)